MRILAPLRISTLSRLNPLEPKMSLNSSQPHPQSQPTQSINISHQPRTTFNTLPLELRREIWNLTFAPRLLCLHIHRRLAPPNVGRNGEYQDCLMRTVAVSFTCTACTSPTSDSGSPDAIFASFARKVAENHKADKLDFRMGSLTCRPSAPGPLALYVCRESREMAMQRYELAFGGVDIDLDGTQKQDWEIRRAEDKEEWDRLQLSQPRIWVDFTRDIIFIDGHFRFELYRKCSPREPLFLIRTYAKDDAAKIRRLAIGAVSGKGQHPYANEIMKVMVGSRVYGPRMPAPGEVRNEYLYGFDSVEELLFDDTVGANDRDANYPMWRRNMRPRLPWNEQATKWNILESLRNEREKGPYKGDVKRLEFVRGREWNEYIAN